MRRINYYKNLPEGYEADYIIDAKGKKTVIRLNIAAAIVAVVLIAPTVFLAIRALEEGVLVVEYPLVYDLIFLIALIVYVICHELVHGAAYKVLTGEKLTFGITPSVAFCGVPGLYTTKRTALISVLAPFVVFTVVFAAAVLMISDTCLVFIALLMIGIHFSGCVGDLWVAWMLLHRYKGKEVLMNDTGPRQTFYI